MKLNELQIPIKHIPGVGEKTETALKKLNIFTVAQLLQHYPRRYEDRRERVNLNEFNTGKKIHTLAKVVSHDWFGFDRMKTLKIQINDGTADAFLLCFNRPFMKNSFPVGSIISITGSFFYKYNELQSSSFDAAIVTQARENPFLESSNEPENFKGVFPVYALTKGLGNNTIKSLIESALKSYSIGLEDEIPKELIEKYNFFSKKDALKKIHNPSSLDDIEKAKKTLIYEELFLFQYAVIKRSITRQKERAALGIEEISKNTILEIEDDYIFKKELSPKQKILVERIPFTLSIDQKKTILEINRDLDKALKNHSLENPISENYSVGNNSKENPTIKNILPENNFHMARLLQGDVGSGKTLVAFFAALYCADLGYQSAFLAPTELLAKQHAQNASLLLEAIPGIKIAFLTGNIKSQGRSLLLKNLLSGNINIIIGTHALFSTNVKYQKLGFIIIDEQHRFGVVQRASLLDKGRESIQKSPSYLMMSATPIPQTLAQTAFGDLDVSTIKTMPLGRGKITTRLTKEGNEKNVYEAVRKEIQKGRQAYFVYPRIEKAEDEDDEKIFLEEKSNQDFFNTEKLDQTNKLKSAEEMFLYLSQEVYPELKLALIHSKIDEEEQTKIMHEFKAGKIDILIATTVVEVGVDVPNANCMVIEHAERFGLAALHQLRGRIGRGKDDSFCFLIYSIKHTDTAKERFKAIHENLDGFKIAELDLSLRGPGEVSGIMQSGNLQLGIADLARDRKILVQAKEDAEKILRDEV